MFRKRFLYCFGGTILRFKDDEIAVEVETKQEKPKTKLVDAVDEVVEEADEEDKSGSDEESLDEISDEKVDSDESDLDIVDLDADEEAYELDFGEHYITQIECLDMQGQRGKKRKWEIITIRGKEKLEG